MQETLYQTADAEVSLSEAVAGDTPSDSGCRILSIRQRMQETHYQTADAEALYQTADSGDNLLDSGCRGLLDSGRRRHSIRQRT